MSDFEGELIGGILAIYGTGSSFGNSISGELCGRTLANDNSNPTRGLFDSQSSFNISSAASESILVANPDRIRTKFYQLRAATASPGVYVTWVNQTGDDTGKPDIAVGTSEISMKWEI